MNALADTLRPVKSRLRRSMRLAQGSGNPLSAEGMHWYSRDNARWSEVLGPLLPVVCAAVLWVAALQDVDPDRMNDLGLVSILPLLAWVALITSIVSFCVAVHRRQAHESFLLLHVIALIGVLHGTPALLYGTLRYSWAWKHLGIVDYIQRHGSVNPTITDLSAYHNWPGFFVLNAMIAEVAGLETPLSFAAWAPMFFNLLFLGPLVLVFKTCTQDRRLIWLSVWFFYLASWVGQDYFAPQALSYFMHLVILGVCLRWFSTAAVPTRRALKQWLRFDWVVSLVHGFISQAARRNASDITSRPLQRAGLMAIIILLFGTIASSHQLTPFMTIAAVTLLVVFQLCCARSLPMLMIILVVTWIIYVDVAFLASNIERMIGSFGQVTNNVDGNLIDLDRASQGQRLVALIGRALTASVWGLAFLGGIRRLRQEFWDLPCVLLAGAPFLLLGGNSYGGEMLFRVYFFSLPFMAFFAAALLYPTPASGTSWRTLSLVGLLSGTMLVGFYFAHYGKDRQYYFTRNEVFAAQYLINVAPAGSLIMEGSQNYPARFQNYERYSYRTLARMPKTQRTSLIEDPVAFILPRMRYKQYTASYLIITRSQKAAVDMVGVMAAGALDKIEQVLMQSPEFKVIYANKDATIFTLADSVHGDGR